MSNNDNNNDKITLTLNLDDVIGKASKSTAGPISGQDEHFLEAEALKKAWFDMLVRSLEKLDARLEELRKELKSEILRVEVKIEKADTDLETYKKEVIVPLERKLLVLTTKLGIWSGIAGMLGAGLFTFLAWAGKEIISRYVGG